MKKTAFGALLLFALVASASALDLRLGLQLGPRLFTNASIKDVYGTGLCLYPHAQVQLGRLFAGAGYELGFKRTGTIGFYDETTTLSLSGLQAFAGYAYDLKKLTPYALAGLGLYGYEQTVDSPAEQPVKETKLGFFAAAGARMVVLRGISASAEIRFVGLSVQPYEDKVGLGGIRILLGLSYALGL